LQLFTQNQGVGRGLDAQMHPISGHADDRDDNRIAQSDSLGFSS
jgi:hypothetical protein